MTLIQAFDDCERLHGVGSTVILADYNIEGNAPATLESVRIGGVRGCVIRVNGRVAGMSKQKPNQRLQYQTAWHRLIQRRKRA